MAPRAGVRLQHDVVLAEALKETAGLLDYLQSPEAKRNAERIRQRRIERRRARLNKEHGTENKEPGTGTKNTNSEPGTRNEEQ